MLLIKCYLFIYILYILKRKINLQNKNKSMEWNVCLNNNRNYGDIQFVWYFYNYLNDNRNFQDITQVVWYLQPDITLCNKIVQRPITKRHTSTNIF